MTKNLKYQKQTSRFFEFNKSLIAFSTLLFLGSPTLAQNSGVQKVQLTDRTEQSIGPTSAFCLGADTRKKTGFNLSQLEDLRVSFNGESVRLQQGNILKVTDGRGVNIPISGNSELPYYPEDLMFSLKKTNNDICISSTALGILKEVSLLFRIAGQGGPNPPTPTPPSPPLPPTPTPTPPLPPPPPPPPQTRIEGDLVTISQTGTIAGWACDTISHRTVEVRIFVNSRLEEVLIADQNTSWSSEMGRPSFGCSSNSGFQHRLNLPKMDEGGTLNIRVTAISPVNGQEFAIGQGTLRLPVLRLQRGIFSVGRDIYFSDGEIGTYCHIPTMDQVRIISNYGYSNRSVSELPRQMRSRGVCEPIPIKEGLFQKTSGPEIYYSNGVDAYCYLTHPSQINGRPFPRLVEVLPAHMRFDGNCQ